LKEKEGGVEAKEKEDAKAAGVKGMGDMVEGNLKEKRKRTP
jgi:hypothetical protein